VAPAELSDTQKHFQLSLIPGRNTAPGNFVSR
jgi:hypothetical protein